MAKITDYLSLLVAAATFAVALASYIKTSYGRRQGPNARGTHKVRIDITSSEE
jgi:hypothetical protein